MIARRVLAIGFALALSGCLGATTPTPQANDFQNRTWVLKTIDGAAFTPLTGHSGTLRFTANDYHYGGLCNGVSGSYNYGPGDQLTLGSGTATIILCPDPAEDLYFSAMRKVQSMQIDGYALTLSTSDGHDLRFIAPIYWS